jgi:hypothetical protein
MFCHLKTMAMVKICVKWHKWMLVIQILDPFNPTLGFDFNYGLLNVNKCIRLGEFCNGIFHPHIIKVFWWIKKKMIKTLLATFLTTNNFENVKFDSFLF